MYINLSVLPGELMDLYPVHKRGTSTHSCTKKLRHEPTTETILDEIKQLQQAHAVTAHELASQSTRHQQILKQIASARPQPDRGVVNVEQELADAHRARCHAERQLQEQRARHEQAVRDMKESTQALKEQHNGRLRASDEQNQAIIKKLAEKAETWKARHSDVQGQMQKLAEKAETWKARHSDMQGQMQKLAEKAETWKARHSDMQGQMQKLAERAEKWKARHADTQEQLQKLAERNARLKASSEESAGKLKAQQEQARRLAQGAEEAWKAKLSRQEMHAQKIVESAEAWKAKHSHAVNAHQALEARGDKWKQRYHELAKENEALKKTSRPAGGDAQDRRLFKEASRALSDAKADNESLRRDNESLKTNATLKQAALSQATAHKAACVDMLTKVGAVLRECAGYHAQARSPLAPVLAESQSNLSDFLVGMRSC